LGLLCNAKKSDRLENLILPMDNKKFYSGLAILEKGNSLGGGSL
jgi:hypothetical protein